MRWLPILLFASAWTLAGVSAGMAAGPAAAILTAAAAAGLLCWLESRGAGGRQ